MSPTTASDSASEILTEGGPVPAASLSPADSQKPEPTLKEDLEQLRSLDCLKAVIVRWRKGIHPDAAIEQLLARRLPIEEQRFLTPFPLRVLTALAIVLTGCTVGWAILWFLCWQLGFTDYVQHLSIWMSLLFVGLGVLVLSHPGRAYDETALNKEIRERLQQLEQTAGQSPMPTPEKKKEPPPAGTES